MTEKEKKRIAVLRSYEVLDSLKEADFDAITSLASTICNTSISLISLVDEDRQWFKSSVGLDIAETSRDISFCTHAIEEPEKIFEVEDASKDQLFKSSPLVTGEPNIRFYAGAPLVNNEGYVLGTLCVIDPEKKKLSEKQRIALKALSKQVISNLELRKTSLESKRSKQRYENILQNLNDIVYELNKEGKFTYLNQAIESLSGYQPKDLVGNHFTFLIIPEDRRKVLSFYQDQLKAKEKDAIIQFRIRCKSEKVKWVRQRTTLTFDENGKFEKAVAVVRDIDQRLKDQEELSRKSQLLESIISTMSSGVFVLDNEGKFLLKNEAANHMLNFNESIKDLDDWLKEYHVFKEDQLSELDGKKMLADFQKNEESIADLELFVKNSSLDQGGFISLNANPIKNSLQKMIGVVIVVTNVNSKKNKEIEIKKRALWLDQSQQMANVGYWEVDLIQQTVFWSDETRRIHEVPEDYVPNLEEGINFYDEESKPIITKAVTNAIENGEPFEEQLKILTAKGNLRWIRTIGKAHYSAEKVTKVLGVFQDITKSKEREERLLRSELRIKELNSTLEDKVEQRTRELDESILKYKVLYDQAPDMMASIDPQTGNIINCNQTSLNRLGYQKEELLGQPIFKIYHSTCHTEAKKAFLLFKEKGTLSNHKLLLVTKGGEEIPVTLNVSAIRDQKGNLSFSNSIWRDITELQRAEDALNELNNQLEQRVKQRTEELEKVNEELEDFTYLTTHDLKTPIANIEGFLSILKREADKIGTKQLDKSIDYIERSVHQANAKIKGLVEIAQIKKIAQQRWTQFPIEVLIQEVLEELAAMIEKNNAKVQLEFNGVQEINFNRTALRMVLLNLLNNSIKYKRPENDPVITIIINKTKKGVEIEVEDNGLGIDLKQQKDKLFGMFNRFHNHVDGHGMGLYYSKKILQDNKASIDIRSQLNKGTGFLIKMPNK